jgi:chromate transporter
VVPLTQLLCSFIKVGATGFGGPFALLALLESEVVGRRRWLTPEQFAQSTAVGALTPGPIFFAAAVHIGYRLRGPLGASLAAAACILPGFTAAVGLAALYIRVENLPAVTGATRGIAAGVTGLLVVLAVRQVFALPRGWSGVAPAALSFLLLVVLKPNPVWVILLGGLLGALVYSGRTGAKGGSS